MSATQLIAYREWLQEHRGDPAVVAGWERVGRSLGGDGR